MSVLRSIESKIEGLFEGLFGRAFRTHVQPVELARKLAKEMDEHRSVSVSRVYVPNEYTIYLSSSDRQQFASYEGSLVGELQEYLTEHARREAYALLTPPRVKFAVDDDLAVGEFGIATRVAQPEEGVPSLPVPAPHPPEASRSRPLPSLPRSPRRRLLPPGARVGPVDDDDLPARAPGPRPRQSHAGARAAARGRDDYAGGPCPPDHLTQLRDRPLPRMRSPRHGRQRVPSPRRDRARRARCTSSSTSARRTARS